jgi:hypothetical protein
LLGLEDQLLCGRTAGGYHAAERADSANMTDERARINIPDSGNLMTVQIELRRFRRPPVRGDLRKLAHNERFNVRPRRLLVVKIGTHIADVRIGQADDLARIAGVGENFLIASEAGIENDFAAAARDSAGSTAVKYAPVFQRKSGESVLNFGQLVLPTWS